MLLSQASTDVWLHHPTWVALWQARLVFDIEMDAQKCFYSFTLGCKTVAPANFRNFAVASQNSCLKGVKLLHFGIAKSCRKNFEKMLIFFFVAREGLK
jgi:hypothetical protein